MKDADYRLARRRKAIQELANVMFALPEQIQNARQPGSLPDAMAKAHQEVVDAVGEFADVLDPQGSGQFYGGRLVNQMIQARGGASQVPHDRHLPGKRMQA